MTSSKTSGPNPFDMTSTWPGCRKTAVTGVANRTSTPALINSFFRRLTYSIEPPFTVRHSCCPEAPSNAWFFIKVIMDCAGKSSILSIGVDQIAPVNGVK